MPPSTPWRTFFEAGVQRLEARRERLAIGNQGLARRHAGGVGGHFLHASKEVRQCGRQSGRAVGKQVVDLADLGAVGTVLRTPVIGLQDLVLEKLVVRAGDGSDVGALPEEARAGEQGRARGLANRLAVVADGPCVGDVVTGRVELGLCRVEARDSDVEHASHDGLPDLRLPDRRTARSLPPLKRQYQPMEARALRSVAPPMMRVSLSAYCGSVA